MTLKLDIKSYKRIGEVREYGEAARGTFGPPQAKGKGGIFATQILGAPETAEVLSKFGKAITIYSARAISMVAIDLLVNAQPRVPVDTGELRESGEATLKFGRTGKEYIGVGRADGTVEGRLRSVNRRRLSGVKTIRAEVSYRRLNEEGEDIALWTHENLQPYGSTKKPRARTLGTGPKYLEIPWQEKVNKYIRFINDEVAGITMEHNIALISKLKQKRVGDYELNYVDLIIDKIQMEGYFKEHI